MARRTTTTDPQLAPLADEVQRRVGDSASRTDVERALKQALAQWPDARIRDFIPILATRVATDTLLGRRG